MHSSVEDLFQFARERVTEQDIIDFSPSDPGYPDYVKRWKTIKTTGVFPTDFRFEITEVIALTGGYDSSGDREQLEGFRRFRRLTTSVALALLHKEVEVGFFRASHYIARDLIIDLDRRCPSHLPLLRAVAASTRDVIESSGNDGYPFFTSAKMILDQLAEDWNEADATATKLIADERAVREKFAYIVQDDRFLLGLSRFDQLDGDWLEFSKNLKNPMNLKDTEFVIEAFRQARMSPPKRGQ